MTFRFFIKIVKIGSERSKTQKMKIFFKFLILLSIIESRRQYAPKSPEQEIEKINKQFHSLIQFNFAKCKIKEKLLGKIDDLTEKATKVFQRCGSIPENVSQRKRLIIFEFKLQLETENCEKIRLCGGLFFTKYQKNIKKNIKLDQKSFGKK